MSPVHPLVPCGERAALCSRAAAAAFKALEAGPASAPGPVVA